MKLRTKRATRVAGAFTLAAGLALAAASPAVAAPPNTAIGLQATGTIVAGPFAVSTFPGSSPNSLVNIGVPGLLSTGAVNTAAGNVNASSSVDNLAVTLSAIASLSAGTVTSSCAFDPNTSTVSGTAGLTNAAFTVLGVPTGLAANPAPNTVVGIPGVATLTLNRQSTAGDGTLTIDALVISLLGSAQNVTVATSVCNAADLAPVPLIPANVAVGALAMLLIGGTSFQIHRRRNLADPVT
ncbi:choice-of-anchor P family protein [Protofrankia symbiont of Coriaria ruscifolia]|uniref:Secreted protein n=1 Tax=Candidatus Protofrankia californiensis TaxID=1839754 RepID=A0A1C3NTP6_9ACTN|nr:choice-of-anchor P family protein [Protofrankia symbiont of Coriaria ruscifolia]SBW18089.1 hypothetical protein FDG2_0511 [Candidatus Protofrankia californiensis]